MCKFSFQNLTVVCCFVDFSQFTFQSWQGRISIRDFVLLGIYVLYRRGSHLQARVPLWRSSSIRLFLLLFHYLWQKLIIYLLLLANLSVRSLSRVHFHLFKLFHFRNFLNWRGVFALSPFDHGFLISAQELPLFLVLQGLGVIKGVVCLGSFSFMDM